MAYYLGEGALKSMGDTNVWEIQRTMTVIAKWNLSI